MKDCRALAGDYQPPTTAQEQAAINACLTGQVSDQSATIALLGLTVLLLSLVVLISGLLKVLRR